MTAPDAPTPDAPATDDPATPDATGVAAPAAVSVVRGSPSPEELAALVAVLAAAGGGDDAGSRRDAREWASPSRALHTRPGVGPHAWARSARPS